MASNRDPGLHGPSRAFSATGLNALELSLEERAHSRAHSRGRERLAGLGVPEPHVEGVYLVDAAHERGVHRPAGRCVRSRIPRCDEVRHVHRAGRINVLILHVYFEREVARAAICRRAIHADSDSRRVDLDVDGVDCRGQRSAGRRDAAAIERLGAVASPQAASATVRASGTRRVKEKRDI
jgi:hypothetical protein